MRFFGNLFTEFSNYSDVHIQLYFEDETTSGLSGVLRHLEPFDRPLDQTTNVRMHECFNPNSGDNNRWFSADFQLGYDPCTCGKNQEWSFNLYGIDEFNLDTDNCQYSLLIEGTAVAEEMFIRINDGSWCDYVFEENYDLRTLYEVEEYIEENGHLPNIPSAAEIEETGIPVGEMERLLTEKVEELTLYIIQMQKEIDTLKQELEKE